MPRQLRQTDLGPVEQDHQGSPPDGDDNTNTGEKPIINEQTPLYDDGEEESHKVLHPFERSHHPDNRYRNSYSNDVEIEMGERKRYSSGISNEGALSESIESAGNRIVTMTGTLKRGQRQGEPVQVQLQLSLEELHRLNKSLADDDDDPRPDCIWGLKKGLHILMFTIIFFPLAFIATLCVNFYLGTQTWYNIYLYLSEERTIAHKIFLCPLLILFYPVLIIMVTLSMAIYGAFIQISWYYKSWLKEIRDFEKGFFGWLCNAMNIPQCSPYQLVILDENPSADQHISTGGTAV